MDLNVSDFSLADSAFVVFDSCVNFAVMLQHLRQGVESQGAIGALVILCFRSMALPVSLHPFRFSSPKGAASMFAVKPLVIGSFHVETRRDTFRHVVNVGKCIVTAVSL